MLVVENPSLRMLLVWQIREQRVACLVVFRVLDSVEKGANGANDTGNSFQWVNYGTVNGVSGLGACHHYGVGSPSAPAFQVESLLRSIARKSVSLATKLGNM
jgi:hypothetical protein